MTSTGRSFRRAKRRGDSPKIPSALHLLRLKPKVSGFKMLIFANGARVILIYGFVLHFYCASLIITAFPFRLPLCPRLMRPFRVENFLKSIKLYTYESEKISTVSYYSFALTFFDVILEKFLGIRPHKKFLHEQHWTIWLRYEYVTKDPVLVNEDLHLCTLHYMQKNSTYR